MKFLKHLLAIAALITGFVGMPAASAATCSLTANGGQPLRAEVNISTITAASDGSPGTVLATRDIPLSNLDYTCGTNVNAELRMAMGTGSALTAVENVYSTTIPGLGYRIRWPATTWWPNALRCSATQNGSCTITPTALRIEFVQTGPLAAGTMAAGTLGTATLLAPDSSSNQLTALRVILMTPISIAVKSCAVTSDVQVNLGDHALSDLAGKAGSPVVKFPLQFNCPNPAAVGITFNGTAPFGYSTSGLIENNGSATGVAVQLLDSSGFMGVRLGKETSLGTISGAKTVNYNARIYRLPAATMAAGTVDAFAVFTLNIR
ncbi:fimbrial protein [Cupriavidus campinensis]